MPKDIDLHHQEALKRFQIIAPLLDTDLERGDGHKLRVQICERAGISERTLRRWQQAYRENGLQGLYPQERSDKGKSRALSAAALDLAKEIRTELPQRSTERICELLEMRGHRVKRSTLERQLRQNGFSGRILKREKSSNPTVGRRFQHEHRNSLWQSDYKQGPYLPDPQRPGKNLATYLLAFIDDATRKVVHAEFYLEQSTYTLMDGLRKAILSNGCPKAIYVDNGKQFTSNWMKLACAQLGILHLTTKPYSPESKGKVERLFRTVEEFMREISLHQPTTLFALNQELRIWVSEGYNRRIHSALDGKSPEEAFAANPAPLRMVSPDTLRSAFLWQEERTVDKSGCVKLLGKTFDTGIALIRKKVTLRFDPLDLSQVEVIYQGNSQGLAKPVLLGEYNGVKRNPIPQQTMATSSSILQMMAKRERQRLRSDIGAFVLSKEGEEHD